MDEGGVFQLLRYFTALIHHIEHWPEKTYASVSQQFQELNANFIWSRGFISFHFFQSMDNFCFLYFVVTEWRFELIWFDRSSWVTVQLTSVLRPSLKKILSEYRAAIIFDFLCSSACYFADHLMYFLRILKMFLLNFWAFSVKISFLGCLARLRSTTSWSFNLICILTSISSRILFVIQGLCFLRFNFGNFSADNFVVLAISSNSSSFQIFPQKYFPEVFDGLIITPCQVDFFRSCCFEWRQLIPKPVLHYKRLWPLPQSARGSEYESRTAFLNLLDIIMKSIWFLE